MIRKTIGIFITLSLILTCSIGLSEQLIFSTGGVAGTYYSYGTVLAYYVSNKTDLDITAVAGSGSADNIDSLDMKISQFAFAQNDIAYYAYNGLRMERFIGNKIQSFSALAAMYPEHIHIITADPEITTVSDLKGKNVSIGTEGSGISYNALDILAAYGLNESDINVQHLSFSESAEAIKNDLISAAFIVAGAPAAAVSDLAASKSIHLIPLDDQHINQLKAISPAYDKAIIPAGTYSGQTSAVVTPVIKATIFVSNDVNEQDAYTFVKTIFEGKEDIAALHNKGQYINPNFASTCGIPYHPGAKKYYSEIGNDPEPDLTDLSQAKITAIKDQVYTGKAIKPKVTVKLDNTTLVSGTDYKVSYKNNKAIGKATVTVTGIGSYTGKITTYFKIIPKPVSLSSVKAGDKQLTVKWKKASGITGYEIQYGLKKNFKAAKTITIKKAKTVNTVIKKLKEGKTYYIRIRAYKTVKGTKYYSAWSAAKKAKVK